MYARFTSRRTRIAMVGAAALSLGLSVAGMATAFEEDPAPAPAPVRTPSAEDVARAQVLQQVARWAIANGYTGLSPVSLRPIDLDDDLDVPVEASASRSGPVAV